MITAMSILLLWQGSGMFWAAYEQRGKEGVVWAALFGVLNLTFGAIGLFL